MFEKKIPLQIIYHKFKNIALEIFGISVAGVGPVRLGKMGKPQGVSSRVYFFIALLSTNGILKIR